jgi:cell division protein FtsQ
LSASSTWHPSRGPRGAGPELNIPARAGRFRRLAVTVVGLSLIGSAAWGVTHSTIFALGSLKVSGNVHVSSADVARIAGLDSRTNVLWLSTGAVAGRLKSDPWIRDVRISRTLPSMLSITVVERTPVAILAGSRLLVSSEGVTLGPADAMTQLPIIEGPAGEVGSARLPWNLPGLRVAASLPKDLAAKLLRIGASPSGDLALTFRDGTKVVFGTAEQVQAKAAALKALLRWMGRTGVRPAYLDVSVPMAPALRPAQGNATGAGA